jgi:hypothetical protein
MYSLIPTRFIAYLTVALLTLGVAAAVHAQTRSTWVYDDNGGGYFENTDGLNWTEFTTQTTFSFREVARTDTYIQLYDASRKISIRLETDQCHIAYPGSGGWRFLYNGSWQQCR